MASISSLSIANSFYALADPLRVQVIEALRSHELCVCDIADTLQITQSKLRSLPMSISTAEPYFAHQGLPQLRVTSHPFQSYLLRLAHFPTNRMAELVRKVALRLG